jgi:hypothetical protein
MSPELLDPEIHVHRRTKYSDCYALGMVIYEVLCRRIPFYRHTDYAVVGKVAKGERPERPQGPEGVVGLKTDVWEVLGRCWTPLPRDRPSIEDVLKRLEKAASSWRPPSLPSVAVPSTVTLPTSSTSDVTSEESMVVDTVIIDEAAYGFNLLKTVLGAVSAVDVRNKIEALLARIAALEVHFATPPGDAAELRHRSDLMRYDVLPPSDSVLSSIQQVQRHWSTVAASVQETRAATAHRPCSRFRRGFRAPRRSAGDYIRLRGLSMTLVPLSVLTGAKDGAADGDV